MTPTQAEVSVNMGNTLSVTNLAQHDIASRSDARFAESITRQESAQLYERALWHYQKHHGGIQDANGDRVDQLMSTVINLYRPTRPLSASPMEMFSTVSPVKDPMSLYAKVALGKAGIAVGSLEYVELRAAAAHRAADLKLEDDDDDESDLSTKVVEAATKRWRESGVSGANKRASRCQKVE
ncbi:hypothetical protein LTR37_011875 [Vermiconidia calcicola]|uniref:Uncharacterized protein n=1 Tax=Vermiconidia calcicola TaxID=1690605 RepID=A0ACC3N116_9PEZI|nr:hypothetical protein LTR37_011875 [Vermiconidia calcicola]